MEDHDIPINVVLIPDLDEDEQILIESYVDIICTCKKKSEVKAAVEMIIDEIKDLNSRQTFIRMTQHLAELINKNK